MQHGTIIYDLDVNLMFSLLKVDDVKIKDKIIKNVKERVTSVRDHGDWSREALYHAMIKGFTSGKEWEWGSLTMAEMRRAEELVRIRYKTSLWNEQR